MNQKLRKLIMSMLEGYVFRHKSYTELMSF